MASELEDLNRKCQRHGKTTVNVVREHGGFRHEYLACGCTLEVAIGLPISVGDAVLCGGELHSVVEIQEDGQLLLVNDHNTAIMSPELVQRIGVDTLSKMYMKYVPTDIKKETFVLHVGMGTVGCVSALLGGSVRCCVSTIDGVVKQYVWPVTEIRELSAGELLKQCTCSDAPHHPTCPLSAGQSISIVPAQSDMSMGASRYFPSTKEYRAKPKKRDSYSSYDTERSEWGWVDPDDKPRQRSQYTYKEPAPKVDSYGISTADLIKDEVRSLEKQQAEEQADEGRTIRPLRTSAPTAPRQQEESSIDPADLQLKKRRGDW